jgi:hypothetical protein
MESLTVLNNLRIASPCPITWDAMRGDDRVRFCDSCSKHVYNVSDLTAEEAVALIQESDGHSCVRLYRRKDGTVLTADCPVGIRSAVRRRLMRLAAAGVIVFAMLRSGVWLFAGPRPMILVPPIPTGPGVTFSDWGDWAARALGVKKPRNRVLVGMIAPALSPTQVGTPPSPDGQINLDCDPFPP